MYDIHDGMTIYDGAPQAEAVKIKKQWADAVEHKGACFTKPKIGKYKNSKPTKPTRPPKYSASFSGAVKQLEEFSKPKSRKGVCPSDQKDICGLAKMGGRVYATDGGHSVCCAEPSSTDIVGPFKKEIPEERNGRQPRKMTQDFLVDHTTADVVGVFLNIDYVFNCFVRAAIVNNHCVGVHDNNDGTVGVSASHEGNSAEINLLPMSQLVGWFDPSNIMSAIKVAGSVGVSNLVISSSRTEKYTGLYISGASDWCSRQFVAMVASCKIKQHNETD